MTGDGSVDGGRDSGPVVQPDSGPMVDVCDRDSVCRDEHYCNGEERCLPGDRLADERGCVPGMPPCAETAVCVEADARCELDECSDGGDADGDGDRRPGCGGKDCDDDNPRVFSTAQEVCDDAGLDEDCNPDALYNTRTNDGDRDLDGFVDLRCFNRRPDGTLNEGTDCDDHPAAREQCDEIDNNCDTVLDPPECDCINGRSGSCGPDTDQGRCTFSTRVTLERLRGRRVPASGVLPRRGRRLRPPRRRGGAPHLLLRHGRRWLRRDHDHLGVRRARPIRR